MSEPVFDSNSSTRIWDLLTSLKTWVKGLLGSLPLRVAAGRISENQMAQPYTKRIYFPEGRFTQVPIVIVTMDNSASGTDGLQVVVAAATTSYADVVFLKQPGATTRNRWCTAGWIAVQMTSTTAAG